MLELIQNTTGLGHALPITPLTGQQQPRPQHEGQAYAPPPAEGVELPEDRVTLSGRLDEVRGKHPDVVQQKHITAPEKENPHEGVSRNEAIGNKVSVGEAPEEDGSLRGASEDNTLDSEQEEEVRDLKQRDAEVKAHEQAHMAAGGGLVQGAASYTYEKGPDGGMYAVGGEVKIDTSPAKDPDQTIAKMQQVRRAALAPAQPSSTDRSVAAQASQIEAQARSEKASETAEGEKEDLTEDVTSAGTRPSTEENGAGDDPTQATPASPFKTPAIQAYQAASGPTRQQFSTFA